MTESGYYPPGAEFDPNAPWNQTEPPEIDFDVCISSTLSKNVKVSTSDYREDEEGEISTMETDWKAAYGDTHCTPMELIEHCKKLAQAVLDNDTRYLSVKSRLRMLIEECNGWSEDELEVVE